MKRMFSIAAGLLVVALTIAGCAHGPGGGNWSMLIDGEKGLENFNRIGDANWRAEGGAIVADKGKGGYLVSKTSYKDFQLRAEFWAETITQSGIHIRAQDPNSITTKNSYEANIYDLRPVAEYGTGAIVDFAKVNPMPKTRAGWNTYLITAKGNNIIVELNGVQTVNLTDASFPSGVIALQFGNRGKEPGGTIKWRKVQVREL